MKAEVIIQKVLGKSEFRLSKGVPLSYLLAKGIIFIRGIVRGIFRRNGIKKCGKRLFVGKHVNMYMKNKIYFGNNVRIENNVTIDALSIEGIHLGDRVKIGENSKIICSGSLSELGKGLRIGSDTSFAENTFFGAAGGIEIGKDIISGQNVRFHSENHNYERPDIPIRLQGVNRKGIKIGDNVWIGAGVVFLDGAEVGNNCIIAANSIVTKKFSDNVLISGTPALEKKKLWNI